MFKQIFYIVNKNHMQKNKSSTVVSSMLKKTRETMQAVLSQEKDIKEYDSSNQKVQNNLRIYSKIKRTIQFSQTKTLQIYYIKTLQDQQIISNNPQRKQNNSNKKQKLATVEDILNKSLKVINSFYSKQTEIPNLIINQKNKKKIIQFEKNFRQKAIVVLKNLKIKSKNLVQHLNIVYYSRSDIRVLSISDIEKYILKQWRENILLSMIRSQWFLSLQQFILELGQQGYQVFQKIFYNKFCMFMSYLTYIVFEPYYNIQIQQEMHDKSQIVDRLSKRTIRYIITQSTQWQEIIHLNILQIIKPKIISPQIIKTNLPILYPIILNEMKIPTFRNLLIQKYQNSIPLFPSVKSGIIRFINQHYIPHKLKCITAIRSALEQDIISYQKQLIQRNELKDLDMFEKDPMLTCLILAVLSSQISLIQIGIALKEVKLMLGQDIENILRIFDCPSYFTDLEAVVEFIGNQVKRIAQ